MIERILLDKAEMPGSGKEIRLYQHDKDFFILAGNEDLMNSRMHESEEALARLAMERIQDKKRPQVLIGGLGMGYSLRAALDGLPANAKVVVAELSPAVVKWNRGVLAGLAQNPLADKRVDLQEVDVAKLLRKAKMSYDAILLDVDNGPGRGIAINSNNWFYGLSGLHTAWRALRQNGVLSVWSAGPDEDFAGRLKQVGYAVEEVRVRSRPGKKGAHHLIWLATKRDLTATSADASERVASKPKFQKKPKFKRRKFK